MAQVYALDLVQQYEDPARDTDTVVFAGKTILTGTTPEALRNWFHTEFDSAENPFHIAALSQEVAQEARGARALPLSREARHELLLRALCDYGAIISHALQRLEEQCRSFREGRSSADQFWNNAQTLVEEARAAQVQYESWQTLEATPFALERYRSAIYAILRRTTPLVPESWPMHEKVRVARSAIYNAAVAIWQDMLPSGSGQQLRPLWVRGPCVSSYTANKKDLARVGITDPQAWMDSKTPNKRQRAANAIAQYLTISYWTDAHSMALVQREAAQKLQNLLELPNMQMNAKRARLVVLAAHTMSRFLAARKHVKHLPVPVRLPKAEASVLFDVLRLAGSTITEERFEDFELHTLPAFNRQLRSLVHRLLGTQQLTMADTKWPIYVELCEALRCPYPEPETRLDTVIAAAQALTALWRNFSHINSN